MTRLIDADNFKTRLEHEAWGRGHAELLRARDIADETPTVNAVPVRHGKWIRHYCEDGNPDGWQCGQCGEWYYFGETKPNFCPNCGARMDEEANETN